MSWKLTVFKLLSNVSKTYETSYYKLLLRELESVKRGFNSPSVRFKTNVWDLYDVLSRASIRPLEEDFTKLRGEVIVIQTKSSERALELLNMVLRGRSYLKENYYKETGTTVQTNFLNWYSNEYSFNELIETQKVLLGLWCVLNPDEESGRSLEGEIPPVERVLIEFLTGKEFKLMITDLIELIKFNLSYQIRQGNL